jgi:hypothetical protein
LDSYARDLPNAFPAVAVAENSWRSYARAFLYWMDYAGLVVREGADYRLASDNSPAQTVRLLESPSPLKYRPAVPQIAPRRAVELLKRLHLEIEVALPTQPKDREAAGTLYALGAVSVSQSRQLQLKAPDLVLDSGDVNPTVLRRLLATVPGGPEGIRLVEDDPRASPRAVGLAIASAARATWTDDTLRGVGGHFRSWCKLAGLRLEPPRRQPTVDTAQEALM